MAIRKTLMQKVVQLTLTENDIRRAVTEFCRTQDSELTTFSVDRLDFLNEEDEISCKIEFVKDVQEQDVPSEARFAS